MVHMTLDMPEEALAALRTDPENFTRELRLTGYLDQIIGARSQQS